MPPLAPENPAPENAWLGPNVPSLRRRSLRRPLLAASSWPTSHGPVAQVPSVDASTHDGSAGLRLARALGRIGRVLITAGILILLFVAYQLWGTGLQTDQAQDSLRDQFNQAEAGADDPPASTTDTTGGTTTPTTAPGDAEPAATPVIPPAPAQGELVGRIQIPAIGADWYFLEGVDLGVLKDGPGHYMGTPLPGQPGNAAIAGHRTTYGAPFNRVDELKSGDEIIVSYLTGASFTYGYRSTEIVAPDRVEVLQAKDFDEDGEFDNTLTLTACHPKYSARERIIIRARLTELPAPAPTRPQPRTRSVTLDDDGLKPPVSKTPAVLWGIAAAMIWLAAWFVARAWRRWPSYVLAFPAFMVTLYVFFENFYALLPAGF